MWSSPIIPFLVACASLSAANPVPEPNPQASTNAPALPLIHTPTSTPASVLTHASTIQTASTAASASATNSRYIVTHAEISQHQGDVIPSHDTTATIIQTIEKFDMVVKGTNAGALPVQCNATWIATMAVPTSDAVGTQFSCSDPAVSALMLRQDADPSIGWWIMVELNNKKPEMWMQKDLAAEDGWTLTSTGMWIFDGGAYSSPMPTESLAQYLGHAPASA